ncbi:MAG TPA: hypothetical protein VD866_07780 [Urbifossiella sp.]|nr:hypothetical protein [Urbifossiella sp.]
MADTFYLSGKPVMVPYTPAAAKAAGEVVVIGATPFVVHVQNPPFGTTTIRDAVAARGGIYGGVADGVMAVGGDAFWDDTNNKFTATSVGNTHFGTVVSGPTADLVGAGPTTDGDTVYVIHEPRGVGTGLAAGKKSEATASTTATLTAAQLLGGFINSAPAGAINLTLPTAALMVAGIPGAKVGDSFDVSIENTSGGANAITLVAGGATLRGGTSIAQNKAALLRVLITNVTAAAEAYTVHSIIGA